ncbi:Ribosomal protein S18 acetylase RimI [Natronoarchaeum philippinense]|uniref:Ribosomal protein S18 acetylase RimI n=1 Tax=Natronoarchaeum philippinense TaxID=558529 RepID=A0A285N5R7_NATPI|nr:GNAT family N-acetyltransferase [Natronoarchaeum philippinense]SNZ04668.1 Ribosomal protein S18 acetylase RimI [Natronoarchaeum philippinense]
MDVRRAEVDDGEPIREVARQSMYASYSMSPDTIDAAVEQWYGEDEIDAAVAVEGRQFLVAERDGSIVGFADAVVVGDDETGDLHWLHVHPDYRGEGIARTLLDETRDALEERGVDVLRGMVLADNSEGNAFYRHHGFETVDEREIEIDGQRHVENIYVESVPSGLTATVPAGGRGEEGTDERLIEVATDDDGTVYADREDTETGTMAPFLVAYSDRELEDRFGYYCGNCESLATAMNSMGRIECGECGNARKPSRWDASYL